MNIIGISPLVEDSTVSFVSEGKVKYAIAEERLSRQKLHAGFPYKSLKTIFEKCGLTHDDIDHVAYPFYDWQQEGFLILQDYVKDFIVNFFRFNWKTYKKLRILDTPKQSSDDVEIPGLAKDKIYMNKPLFKRILYEVLAGNGISDKFSHQIIFLKWAIDAVKSHKYFSKELYKGLSEFNLSNKLIRVNHHAAHAYKAYFCSNFSRALVVTLDAYGSSLAGTVFLGEAGQLKRLVKIPYPNSLGLFYEDLTSSLGFTPSRHEGKIVGLAAYGNPQFLFDAIRAKFEVTEGTLKYFCGNNKFFNRRLSTKFKKIDIAASYQKVLEKVVSELVEYYAEKYEIDSVAVSGGVAANVKLNQKIFETKGIKNIFIYPNMGDGGTATGAALKVYLDKSKDFKPYKLDNVYFGPDYSDSEIESLIRSEGLRYERIDDIEKAVAARLAERKTVARFNGRMEYGPRALGNRSILYQADEPEVNLWLNKRLGRTEFMPFAPSTLYEHRHQYYEDIDGADYSAEYMTITFNCTSFMKEKCPAAVHVDGTARPQLVKEETSPSYFRIIDEYRKITGIATIINTSFNMHEEPIVCTPADAIKAFKQGHLHYLAINNFLVIGKDEG